MLDKLDQRIGAIENDVGVVRKQNELAQLDRDWEAAKKLEFKQFNPDAAETRLSNGTILVLLPAWIVGFLLIVRIHFVASVFWLLCGLFILAQVVANDLKGSRQFEDAKSHYEKRREELVRAINGERTLHP
ncbi:hypothetical protein ACFL2H_10490 [Planctomycetota bacterium]